MDPIVVASAVVSLLKETWQAIEREPAAERLLGLVKEKAEGDSFAQAALEGFEARPDSPRRRVVLEQALAEATETDPAFGAAVEGILQMSVLESDVRASGSGIVISSPSAQRSVNVVGRDLFFDAN